MRTYAEAYAAARDGRPFSNGTEGYGWMDAWCSDCIHDRGTRDGTDETGCPLVMVALMAKTPSEWLDGPRDEHGRYGITDQYHCVEYRDENDPGPGYEPVDPVSPDQLELFDAEPWRRVRMYGPTRELVSA